MEQQHLNWSQTHAITEYMKINCLLFLKAVKPEYNSLWVYSEELPESSKTGSFLSATFFLSLSLLMCCNGGESETKLKRWGAAHTTKPPSQCPAVPLSLTQCLSLRPINLARLERPLSSGSVFSSTLSHQHWNKPESLSNS